jgi:hypothetical protein
MPDLQENKEGSGTISTVPDTALAKAGGRRERVCP